LGGARPDTIEGGQDATAASEWAAVKRVWKPFPIYLTPGNHDIWSPASEKIWRAETGHPPYYSFDYQDAHFSMMDNSRNEDLSPDQYRFLASDLAKNQKIQVKVIVFHRPLWLIPVLLQDHQFPLHQLARRYGVNAVLSGHVHQLSRHHLDGIEYIMAGSSGGHIDRGWKAGQGEAEGWFFQWMAANVDGTQITFTVHKLKLVH
jgi:Icc protein